MTKDRFKGALSMVLFLTAGPLFLWGCSSTAPSRFYALSPVAASEAKTGPETGSPTVGITHVKIPDYLDRPQIATRVGPNELRYDEFSRWAEPLKENFSRVLAENLSAILGTDKVHPFPRAGALPVDCQLWVEVIQFDANPAGDVSLVAKWAIVQPDGKKMLTTKRFVLVEPAGAPGHEAMVAAGSRAVAGLSREIAEVIRTAGAR